MSAATLLGPNETSFLGERVGQGMRPRCEISLCLQHFFHSGKAVRSVRLVRDSQSILQNRHVHTGGEGIVYTTHHTFEPSTGYRVASGTTLKPFKQPPSPTYMSP